MYWCVYGEGLDDTQADGQTGIPEGIRTNKADAPHKQTRVQ